MVGTIRTFDEKMRKEIHERVIRTAEEIAKSAGATATVTIPGGGSAFVTYNDPALTEKMTPTLKRTAGEGGLIVINPVTGSEDFPSYTQTVPGLFYFLGGLPKGQDPSTAARNHSPYFFVDEAALPVGVRSMANLAMDYLKSLGSGKTAGR